MTTRKGVRARLLDAADSILFIDGPVNTPVDAIIQRAEAGPASLYAHFGSKDGITTAALERRLEVWSTVWQEEIDRAGSDAARLLAIFPALERYQRDYLTERWCAFSATAAAIPRPSAALAEVLKAEDKLLRTRLAEQALPIAGEEAARLVEQILVAYCGTITLMLRRDYPDAIAMGHRTARALLEPWLAAQPSASR
ncbi:MAG: TetR/AcrR family transcriptional regulator [Flaviflexus sp.]|nr:TetR/AcrR family transcriptional regulator [Flaviflexus sp.]